VTASADKNARYWKIVLRTCLVFKGMHTSLECVSLINEDRFITGGQDGYGKQSWNFPHTLSLLIDFVQTRSIQLWNTGKKRAEVVVRNAHAVGQSNTEDASSAATAMEVAENEAAPSDASLFHSNNKLAWITSVAALRYGDIFATGSATGQIKIWRTHTGWRQLTCILEIPMVRQPTNQPTNQPTSLPPFFSEVRNLLWLIGWIY